MDKQKVAKAILKLAKELVSKTVKKASIKTAERMTVNGVKVWISTGGNIRAEVSESHIELLLDALKVKGKLRNIKKLDIYDAKMRGQNIEFVSADATTADRKILDFTATIIQSGSKSKVRIDSLELESENELSDGALAFVEEFGEAAEDILSDMDYGMCDVDDFDKSGFTPGAYDLKLDGEEYLGFKDSDDAETEAIRQVREDLENASELFNQRWLMGFIDESNAESFFRGVYDDLNNGYVDDIKNEDSRSGYGSRFDDELVDRGIVEEEDIIWTEDDPYIPDDEDEAELLIGTVKENWDSRIILTSLWNR